MFKKFKTFPTEPEAKKLFSSRILDFPRKAFMDGRSSKLMSLEES